MWSCAQPVSASASIVCGLGVVQPGDRESGPVGPEVLAPGRSAFANSQMSWGDVTFDANFSASVLGDLAGAPTLHAGDVELGKSASSHLVATARQRLIFRNRVAAISTVAGRYRGGGVRRRASASSPASP
jgi:hypothetical protein